MLVRHGATSWSEAGRLCGWTDVALSPAGRARASALAPRLGRRGFDGVWSSDLSRALETARLAAGEPVADARLREIDFGDLEGCRWDQLDASTREALLGFDGFRAPGGGSAGDLRARAASFVGNLPPGRHLVVTHGGVIRALLRERGCERRVEPGGLAVVRA